MRHVVLPTAHSDADLALAGELVAVLNSETLYVAWTHTRGPGTPRVEATVIEDDDRTAPTPAGILAGVAGLLRSVVAFVGGLLPSARHEAHAAEQPARTPVRL